jgi:phosphoglycerate dehydrogenase-like enzyme
MARIAVTDGMAPEAVVRLEKSGHEVVLGFIENEDLLSGALDEFDAIIVRSATKLSAEIIAVSRQPECHR